MKFLKTLWTTLVEFIHKNDDDDSKVLNPTDQLGRFLTSSRLFSEEKKRVKHNAFMPTKNSDTDQYETSLFNIESFNEKQIKEIALKYIKPKLRKGRSIYGTGNSNSKMINEVGLQAIKSEPPVRHVNIIGWPKEKSEQKLFTMELSKMVELALFDSEITI